MTDSIQQKKRLRRIRLIGILVAILLAIPVLVLEFSWEQNHLQRIQSAGKLSVITFNGPTTYFEGNQGPKGFEYELTSAFAEHLDVELDIQVADQFDLIMPAIQAAHGDMAAAGLAITEERKTQVAFSSSYQTIKQQVVYRSGGAKRPRKPSDLTNREIMVTAGSSHVERLQKIKNKNPQNNSQEYVTETPDNMIERLMENKHLQTESDSKKLSKEIKF